MSKSGEEERVGGIPRGCVAVVLQIKILQLQAGSVDTGQH